MKRPSTPARAARLLREGLVKRLAAALDSAGPDEREREALGVYAAELSAGRPAPERFVQPAGDGGVRYYEPLRIMPMCMQCHGPAEQLDPAVRAALAERYPDDRAVGYAEGEFRGLIRVSIPAPPHGAH